MRYEYEIKIYMFNDEHKKRIKEFNRETMTDVIRLLNLFKPIRGYKITRYEIERVGKII